MIHSVNGHKIGDHVALGDWKTRNRNDLFRIDSFESVDGEPWAKLVPVSGGGYYRCPVSDIQPSNKKGKC